METKSSVLFQRPWEVQVWIFRRGGGLESRGGIETKHRNLEVLNL